MARADTDLDSARAGLYRLPREEFTAARNELAKRLRGDGEKAAAADVQALRKPSAAAWVVNQLGHRARADLARLFAAGDRMLDAPDADEMRDASAAEREAIAKLLRRAGEIAGGLPAATSERVRETLHAAAADVEVRERVARGQLESEQRLVALGAGSLGADGETRPPRSRGSGRKRGDEPTAAQRREERRRQREHETAQRELEQAERRHDRAVAAARDAQAELERAQAELERARANERGAADG